jgi:hypothetical protein
LLLIDRDYGRITPQAFELVELPERRVENVDHHIDVIEQYPSALLNAFGVMRARAFLA